MKKDVIRRQLWRHLATRRTITPVFGETVLFEHEFHNPSESEAVFFLHISHPNEVAVVSDAEEWKARNTCASVGRRPRSWTTTA